MAESVIEQIKKGDRLQVVERLKVSDYEKKDGTKAKRVEILADDIAKSVKIRKANENDVRAAFGLEDESEF